MSAANGHTDTAKALLAAGAELEHEDKVCLCVERVKDWVERLL